jgi:hypothetical protein
MIDHQKLMQSVQDLIGEVAILETTLEQLGITVPERQPAAKVGYASVAKATTEQLENYEAALEGHAAGLRLLVRGIGEKPARTNTPTGHGHANQTTSTNSEIQRLESLATVAKGHTLKCLQANIAKKRAELAHKNGK